MKRIYEIDLPRGYELVVDAKKGKGKTMSYRLDIPFREITRPTNEDIAKTTNRADEVGAAFVLGQRLAYDNIFGEEEK